MQNLIFQSDFVSQGCMKKNCMQKFVKMVRLLFLFNSVCPNFLQLSIFPHVKTISKKLINP